MLLLYFFTALLHECCDRVGVRSQESGVRSQESGVIFLSRVNPKFAPYMISRERKPCTFSRPLQAITTIESMLLDLIARAITIEQ
ncbi:hypothetical protein ACP6PL_21320 [Dapis sp. BLCC M126]